MLLSSHWTPVLAIVYEISTAGAPYKVDPELAVQAADDAGVIHPLALSEHEASSSWTVVPVPSLKPEDDGLSIINIATPAVQSSTFPEEPSVAPTATVSQQPRAVDTDDVVEVETGPFTLSEDGLLIFQMRLGRYLLSDAMIGYESRGRVCLLLEDVVNALEFNITYDGSVASGWFLREDRSFFLDTHALTLTIEDNEIPLLTDEVVDDGGFPCVDVRALEKWFPVDLDIDIPNAVVTVESRTPLPIEERIARRQRRTRIVSQDLGGADYNNISVAPYEWLSWPIVDAALSTATSADKTVTGYDLFFAGDVAKLSGQLALTGDSEAGLNAVRGRLGREDPRGVLPQGPRVTSAFAGTVSLPGTRFSVPNSEVIGFTLSSFDLDQPDLFDRTTLRGNLPEGWEVELYRNGALIASQAPTGEGQYEFVDIPVYVGRNEFKFILYGPQGQRREKVENIYVDGQTLKPGRVRYQLGAGRLQGLSDGEEGYRVSSRFDVGLSKSSTISVAATSLAGADIDEAGFVEGAFRAAVGGIGLSADLSHRVDGGTAYGVSVQSARQSDRYFLSHSELGDFEGSGGATNRSGGVSRRSSLEYERQVSFGNRAFFPVAASLQRSELESGARQYSFSGRVSGSYRFLSATNTLNRVSEHRTGSSQETMNGSTLFNISNRFGILRGEVEYAIKPRAEWTSARLAMSKRFRHNLGMEVNLDYAAQEDVGSVAVSLNGIGDRFRFGTFGSIDTNGDYRAGLALSMSVARQRRDARFVASPQSIAKSGAFIVRGFVDENANQQFDASEEVFPDLGLLVNARRTDSRDMQDDGVLLTAVAPNQPVRIGIDLTTLTDPYLMGPDPSNAKQMSRAGRIQYIDIPLSRTGEIVGTVLLQTPDGPREVGGIELEIIDEVGEVVIVTQSEFDGFTLFERVPYGSYRMRIVPEQAARLNLRMLSEISVRVDAQQDVIEGLTISIARDRLAEDEMRLVSQTGGEI